MTTELVETEPLAAFRERRRREAVGRRGPAAFVWGDFVVEPDQHVEGAPGRWSPRPDGRPGLLVRATAADGIRIGGELVDGEAVLEFGDNYTTEPGAGLAEFPDGAEGVVFSYDGTKFALQVWNPRSEWAARYDDIAVFDPDPSWVVEAAISPVADGRTVAITHHRDPAPVEVPVVADVAFERDGETFHLAVTGAGPYADRLLVHFRDATNGSESYGAGRSLWFPADHHGPVVLDFNRATLLPCSFSRAWNCPLPPVENTLPIAVRAGERNAVDAEGKPLL